MAPPRSSSAPPIGRVISASHASCWGGWGGGTRPHPRIWLGGVAEGPPDSPSAITQRGDMTRLGLAKAAPRAFAMAGVTTSDIDVAEIYDCFTYIVLYRVEDLCPSGKGEGGAFVEGGTLGLHGRLPVNPPGGLLSLAHIA